MEPEPQCPKFLAVLRDLGLTDDEILKVQEWAGSLLDAAPAGPN